MNSLVPDTRESLILRLPDRGDIAAWDEFAAIYQPLVYRLARAKGLQHADAQEVVQEVLLAVSRAVERWKPDSELGRFRDWLFRISRNLVINYLTRKQHRGIGSGDSRVAELLQNQSAQNVNESTWFDMEVRREIFHYCARRVRAEVSDKTWRAFWMSSVERQTIAAVAQQLGMTHGAIYIARSRAMAKLRESAEQLLANQGLSNLQLTPLHPTAILGKGKS